MRIVAYKQGGKTKVGNLAKDGQTITPFALGGNAAEQGALAVMDLVLAGKTPEAESGTVKLSDVELLAPIPKPRRNVFCVGKNYFDHAHEFAKSGFDSSAAAGAVPDVPIIFSKVPESVIASGQKILFDPKVSTAIDYEVELALVIGKGGRGISKADALNHVWGYTIINDVTARDVQGRHKQWLLGKSFDTFCPMGPALVTADELGHGPFEVRCWVNGEQRQKASTDLLIFDIPTLIECISSGITLIPGDIISTGTPAGVGIGFTPPKYLKAGDVVRQEIPGIGVIENTLAEI